MHGLCSSLFTMLKSSVIRTYFPDAHATVKLELGEFLIHPGNLVHSGVDIQSGTRYLMVLFTHITHIE
jgi:hypothetical protein